MESRRYGLRARRAMMMMMSGDMLHRWEVKFSGGVDLVQSRAKFHPHWCKYGDTGPKKLTNFFYNISEYKPLQGVSLA